MEFLQIFVVLLIILNCNGIESRKIFSSRRFGGPGQSMILGVPMISQHLPPAEPILPGHSLIRPSIEMLKSAVKFPHREQENGAGVYGNIDSLGIKYDGRNERVLYTKFRRSLPEDAEKINMPIYNYPRIRRHFETAAKKRNKLVGYRNPYGDNRNVNKVLTIYAAVPVSTRPKHTHIKHEKRSSLRYLENKIPVYLIKRNIDNHDKKLYKYDPQRLKNSNENLPFKTIAMETMNGSQLLNFFSSIKSLRRDQDIQQLNKKVVKKYVPGKVGYGKFSLNVLNSDEDESRNKTAMFWKTKGQFNHVKIDADAPDQTDFLPIDHTEQERQWWFYHQSDFEQFADK